MLDPIDTGTLERLHIHGAEDETVAWAGSPPGGLEGSSVPTIVEPRLIMAAMGLM
jgi:hypothetical protein